MLSGDPNIDVIFDAKRFIGRVFKDEQDLEAIVSKQYPFEIVLQNNTGMAFFKLSNGIMLSPVDVGSLIVKELALAVQRDLKGAHVHNCVMAVPAEFDTFQRNETSKCAQKAGINVKRVINEPTAAALAYGLDHRSQLRPVNVIVVDVGGGTTDISLMRVEKSMFLTIAMAGVRRLSLNPHLKYFHSGWSIRNTLEL